MPRTAEPQLLHPELVQPPKREAFPNAWIPKAHHSPYDDVVLRSLPNVSLVVDGQLQKSQIYRAEKNRRSHIVAVAPAKLSFFLFLHEGPISFKIRCCGTTSLVTSATFTEISVGRKDEADAQDVYSFFQNNESATCGAVKLTEVDGDIDSDSASFHKYCSRSGEEWIVLNTEAKRVNVLERPKKFTALLSSATSSLAKCCGETLCDAFRDVSLGTSNRPLLASNFTVLKKFLLKHNDAFVWRQDNSDRATRICARN